MAGQQGNTKITVETLRALHAEAKGQWRGADWAHEQTEDAGRPDRVGRTVRDTSGEPIYCEGGNKGCHTCECAREDAGRAEEAARDLIAAAERGDWDAVARLAPDLRGLENQYGDCPTWGPLADAAEEAPAQQATGYAAIGTDGRDPVVWAVGETEEECERDLASQGDAGETTTVRATVRAITEVRAGGVGIDQLGVTSIADLRPTDILDLSSARSNAVLVVRRDERAS